MANAMNAATPRLSSRTLLWYALPQIPHSFAILPVVNYIPAYYSDNLGLPLAMVGLMLVLSRVTDVITDPLIGTLSDGAKSRFGRRKPFIVLGIPMMLAAAWMLFAPPAGVGLDYLFWGLFFLYLGFTIVDIPYNSWGAELSSNYDERSRVTALRGAFSSAGSLLTLAIPVVMQMLGYKDTALVLIVMALAFIIFQPLLFAGALAFVPERPATEIPRVEKLTWRVALAAITGNEPLLRLMGAMFLLVTGMAIGATLNMIIFRHVIGQPDFFAPAVFIQNVVAIAVIPLWLGISKRIGKHRALAIAMLVIGLCSALTFLAGRDDGWLLAVLVVGIGAGMGALLFLISSMTADLTDADLLATGRERTGLYMAATGMAGKAAAVVGVLIGTTIPALAGFQPSDAVHSADALLVLRAVYAFVCPALAIPAAIVIWFYPLDRAAQEDLRRRIEVSRAQEASA